MNKSGSAATLVPPPAPVAAYFLHLFSPIKFRSELFSKHAESFIHLEGNANASLQKNRKERSERTERPNPNKNSVLRFLGNKKTAEGREVKNSIRIN
jgi:hypothetical protein